MDKVGKPSNSVNSSHCQWNAEMRMIVSVYMFEEELCFLYDESAVFH
jgi:hypothetical protein